MLYEVITLLALIVVAAISFQACKDTDPVPEANPLTADAGEDQEAAIGGTVTLDGSASEETNGSSFTYSWSFKSKPAGSVCPLDDNDTASPQFIPDKAGTFVIQLTISRLQWSSKDEITVTVSGSYNFV